MPVTVARTASGCRCEYMPLEVGTSYLHLTIGGKRVQPLPFPPSPSLTIGLTLKVEGSPFAVSVYAPHLVRIDPMPGGAVGKPVQFVVDASAAGRGQLEISINQGRVPNSVTMEGPGRCLVTFIPASPGTYIVDVTFNGELVKGCPARVDVSDKAATTAVAADFRGSQERLTESRTTYTSSSSGAATSLQHQPQSGHYEGVTSLSQLRSSALPPREFKRKASTLSCGRY